MLRNSIVLGWVRRIAARLRHLEDRVDTLHAAGVSAQATVRAQNDLPD